MFSWRSHKENAELTERFPISENGQLIQDLPGIHRLVKLTVNEGVLAMMGYSFASRKRPPLVHQCLGICLIQLLQHRWEVGGHMLDQAVRI